MNLLLYRNEITILFCQASIRLEVELVISAVLWIKRAVLWLRKIIKRQLSQSKILQAPCREGRLWSTCLSKSVSNYAQSSTVTSPLSIRVLCKVGSMICKNSIIIRDIIQHIKITIHMEQVPLLSKNTIQPHSKMWKTVCLNNEILQIDYAVKTIYWVSSSICEKCNSHILSRTF